MVALALAFAVAFSHALLARFGQIHDSESAFDDWDLYSVLSWVPYVEIVDYRQFPLWDPYRCSGVPLLGYAESRFLTPFFLVSLAFGPFVGIDVEIVAHLAIAWAGGYVLGRVSRLDPLASAACASVFPASSFLTLHVAVGHLTILPYAYLPWIVACVLVSIERRILWPAAIGGLLLALVLGEGGIAHVFVYALPFVALLVLVVALLERSAWPFCVLAMTVGSALGLGAIKLLPILAYASARPIADTDSVGAALLAQMFFGRDQDRRLSLGTPWGYWEYGAYLGVPFAVLAAIGAASRPRRALPWIVLALAMLTLTVGDYGPYAPWTLLHRLPVFDSLRVPSRWVILVIAALAPLVGFGVERLSNGRAWRAVIAVLVVVIAVADAWVVGSGNLSHVPPAPELTATQSPHFQQLWDADDRHMLRLARANTGALNCENELVPNRIGPARGPNQPGYRGEQYVVGDGSVRLARWSPNALSYDVHLPAVQVMIVNQRYDPAWRVVEGAGEVVDQDGLLGVRLPAGDQRVSVSYRSRAFQIGAAISVAAGILVALLVRRGV